MRPNWKRLSSIGKRLSQFETIRANYYYNTVRQDGVQHCKKRKKKLREMKIERGLAAKWRAAAERQLIKLING